MLGLNDNTTDDDNMMTMADFIDKSALSFEWARIDTRPGQDKWSKQASHYLCTITHNPPFGEGTKSHIKVHYSKESGHKGVPPDFGEVLDAIVSDIAWIADETDLAGFTIREIRQIESQAAWLLAVLGPEDYETLMYRVERL